MTANIKFGPWIAFNPGDKLPTDGKVQRWRDGQSRREAEGNWIQCATKIPDFDWDHIVQYRRVIEPVLGEVVLYMFVLPSEAGISSGYILRCGSDTHRLILPTEDGKIITDRPVTVRMEPLK